MWTADELRMFVRWAPLPIQADITSAAVGDPAATFSAHIDQR